ncbi:MFS transporter [Amphritea sp. HPY]|uniref:MFS transporter n=1 Tax=Amphritea sp. HPY TaxID=3421652 RepID=UPI003D7D935C
MRTYTKFMFGGILQLSFICLLAVLLLFAAYQRADMVQSFNEIARWGAISLLLSGSLLFAGGLWCQRLSVAAAGRMKRHLLVLASLAALACLLLLHLSLGTPSLTVFDVATALLIAFLFTIELAVLQQGMQPGDSGEVSEPARPVNFKLMRPAIFLFLFGIDLSMSFIPLHMEELPQSLAGISTDLLIGLPISVEFFCVGVAILWCGVWLDRCGWQQPFYTGLLLTGVGCLYSWLATDAINFILSRGVLGLGYGLTLLAAQGYVIRHTDSANKSRGLAHLFAGLYSGSICGAATGAVMAELFGYSMVFLCGGIIVFSVIFYAWLQLRENNPEPAHEIALTAAQQPTVSSGVMAFLSNRQVLAATLFSSLPASIAVVGFLNYFSPVYLNRAGAGESTIGQVLMLFGVVLALFGPAVGRFADRSETKRIPIVLGCILGSCAFLVFYFVEGVIAVTLAVLLLGLSNCLVLSAQSAFVLKQDVTRQFGEGKAMGVFRSSSRIGQMLGPVIFAGLIVSVDIEQSVMLFGVGYFVTAILFWWLSGKSESPLQKPVSKEAV